MQLTNLSDSAPTLKMSQTPGQCGAIINPFQPVIKGTEPILVTLFQLSHTFQLQSTYLFRQRGLFQQSP